MNRNVSSGWSACPAGEFEKLTALLAWRRLHRLAVGVVAGLVIAGAAVATAAGVTDGFRSLPFHTQAAEPGCGHEPVPCDLSTAPK